MSSSSSFRRTESASWPESGRLPESELVPSAREGVIHISLAATLGWKTCWGAVAEVEGRTGPSRRRRLAFVIRELALFLGAGETFPQSALESARSAEWAASLMVAAQRTGAQRPPPTMSLLPLTEGKTSLVSASPGPAARGDRGSVRVPPVGGVVSSRRSWPR